MKRTTTMLSAFAVAMAFALPGWAQVKELPKQTVTVTGTVETIDQSRRAVNIKTADGKFVALDVPASAKRFDELKVGDKVGVTYNNNVLVRLKPAGEAAVNTSDTASTMGKEARPGGTADDPDPPPVGLLRCPRSNRSACSAAHLRASIRATSPRPARSARGSLDAGSGSSMAAAASG